MAQHQGDDDREQGGEHGGILGRVAATREGPGEAGGLPGEGASRRGRRRTAAQGQGLPHAGNGAPAAAPVHRTQDDDAPAGSYQYSISQREIDSRGDSSRPCSPVSPRSAAPTSSRVNQRASSSSSSAATGVSGSASA